MTELAASTDKVPTSQACHDRPATSLLYAGVSRERLESFDRPIKVEPEDYPDKRDALIGDFRNYLSILKSVHSGADLAASAQVSSPA